MEPYKREFDICISINLKNHYSKVGLARFASMLSAKSTQFWIDRIHGILLLHFRHGRQTAKPPLFVFISEGVKLLLK